MALLSRFLTLMATVFCRKRAYTKTPLCGTIGAAETTYNTIQGGFIYE